MQYVVRSSFRCNRAAGRVEQQPAPAVLYLRVAPPVQALSVIHSKFGPAALFPWDTSNASAGDETGWMLGVGQG
eukprot:scaffold1938_cov399-Prasinococcus_capsulatus_cf.AAC.16